MPGGVQLAITMNFWANSSQPVAGAMGVVSRVQLPAVGQIAIAPLDLGRRALPVLASAAIENRQRGSLHTHRAQHRAQCRANCMSKANF